ncbi:MAG: energy-coupling factor transporter transmembrane component T family protein [Thermodesulfobacteriota bacterium]
MRALYGIEAAAARPSVIHRLDARTKMTLSLAASVAVVVLSDPTAMAFLFAASAGYALLVRRPVVFLIAYAVVCCMWCAAIGMMAGMHLLMPRMPTAEPAKLLVPFLRTGVMLNVALALALSSRIQALLSTLKSLRLPFCIYVPLAVMIRFLPTFVEDVRQIGECLRTRGYRLTPVHALVRPLFTARLLLAPLLFRSLRSSDELGMAAELKGLGSARKLTPLTTDRFSREDLLIAGLALLVIAAGAGLQMMLGGGGGMHG